MNKASTTLKLVTVSHGGEYEDCCLKRVTDVSKELPPNSGSKDMQVIGTNFISSFAYSFILKMETVHSSDLSVKWYQITHHILEDAAFLSHAVRI
jgi:hypothetical protein